MKIDPTIETIITRGLSNELLTKSELLRLFRIAPHSEEHVALREARQTLAKRSFERTHGQGTLFAQIGIDAQPCPGNCFHCSFAARFNTRSADTYFLSDEQILSYAQNFADQGANVITLMVTEAFDFTRLLNVVSLVRTHLAPSLPIQVNMGDFTYEQAKELKEAGVSSIYHAIRMGEGLVNDIPLERRFQTFAAASEAGLKIGAGLENITPQFTDNALAAMMLRFAREITPYSCSCTSKRLVKGTAGFDQPDFPADQLEIYQLAFTLLMGRTTKIVGGQIYAEAGTNPRDWSLHTEKDGLIKQRGTTAAGFIKELQNAGYIMQPGPSPLWG